MSQELFYIVDIRGAIEIVDSLEDVSTVAAVGIQTPLIEKVLLKRTVKLIVVDKTKEVAEIMAYHAQPDGKLVPGYFI